MMNERPLLQISGLTVAIQGREILNQLDLEIFAGEIAGLVGESGAGKTLTALAILGLLPSRAKILSGEIRYQGLNLLNLKANEMRQVRGGEIGIVFQDPRAALDPVMRIDKQLCEGMRFRLGYSRKRAVEESSRLLDAVGIEEPERCLKAYPHQLSGGMRQRILIAAALSCKPRVMVCDEITSSVDSIVQAQLLTLLVRLRKTLNISILLITHDLWVVRRISDRVSVLLQGKVVEEGATEQIFDRPTHPFTRTLIDSLPSFEQR